ncbi:MAG: 4-hydroxyphenylpyruvate dioxygenase [Gammaproteobacteria bacterium]|jgi:4-hydroxyphenylpyruvate dioxygenase
MGVDGFEFVEYAAPDGDMLHALFNKLGFTAVAKHKSKNITLYRQGGINFLVNEEPNSFAADFAAKHGPCACGFAIRVADEKKAYQKALEKDARPIENKPESLAVSAAAIEGIGGSVLYMTDRYGEGKSVYDADFEPIAGVDQHPTGAGLNLIDHLTHNVHKGEMDTWAGYYERLFNFHEVRYFDIKGKKTGLFSRAMTAPDGMVRIPINEAQDDKSQIAEYLREYDGEGIQHIALYTDNIYDTVESLRDNGIEFQDTLDAYYDIVDQRVPEHGEDLERMKKNRILIDADQETRKKLLLQIFTKNCIGPIFFEIIQRKGNEGFGEGNFQALFEAIELDQERRGVI